MLAASSYTIPTTLESGIWNDSAAACTLTSLQHAGAKFPAAVDEMARRGVVALSRLRSPSICGESNELCFPFEELGQFLPPVLVTFLHQGSDVGAGWNGVTWKEQAENPFESSVVYNAQRPHVSDAPVNQQICYLRTFCCRAMSSTRRRHHNSINASFFACRSRRTRYVDPMHRSQVMKHR